jgi:hypothetical protein
MSRVTIWFERNLDFSFRGEMKQFWGIRILEAVKKLANVHIQVLLRIRSLFGVKGDVAQ